MRRISKPPYADPQTPLILRDHLAIDRTRLANERTLLAWWRTGLTLLIAGVTLIKLFDEPLLVVSGYLLLPLGLGALGFGLARYLRLRRTINTSEH